ncbi:MAG: hypothetical protein QGG36_20290 [Pirellulaceae bacterium]|jgi:hypothetical protein|nr:hypothetical protein [Pirellulaceae bacterium]MDP7018155.1 hypothetical protein [Pirellulaceae bacterium]
MKRFPIVVLLAAGALLIPHVRAEKAAEPQEVEHFRAWSGGWQVSVELSRLLGYRAKRADATMDHPVSFELSIDKEIGGRVHAEKVAGYRDLFNRKLKHRLVATGRCQMQFEIDAGIGPDCFITEQGGAMFLWVEAPYVAVYGGRVSITRGRTPADDMLAIDFNPTLKTGSKKKTPDTFAFRRVKKEKTPSGRVTEE